MRLALQGLRRPVVRPLRLQAAPNRWGGLPLCSTQQLQQPWQGYPTVFAPHLPILGSGWPSDARHEPCAESRPRASVNMGAALLADACPMAPSKPPPGCTSIRDQHADFGLSGTRVASRLPSAAASVPTAHRECASLAGRWPRQLPPLASSSETPGPASAARPLLSEPSPQRLPWPRSLLWRGTLPSRTMAVSCHASSLFPRRPTPLFTLSISLNI